MGTRPSPREPHPSMRSGDSVGGKNENKDLLFLSLNQGAGRSRSGLLGMQNCHLKNGNLKLS